MDYNFKEIRNLIKKSLTDEDFNNLVFYDFRDVHQQFTDGQTQDARIRLLLSHAEKYRKIDVLLKEIQSINYIVFKDFEERVFREKTTTTKVFKTDSNVQLNTISYGKSILSNSSLTLYAFHLRNSKNLGPDKTVPEASHLWEKLSELGELLKIEDLQSIRQKLICYQDNQYYPEVEEEIEVDRLTLLRDGTNYFEFVYSKFKASLSPFRLHDTYAIDLTVFLEDAISLDHLGIPNLQHLLNLYSQACLGQSLFFFASSSGHENYQELSNACVAQLVPESEYSLIDLIAEGCFLGNPIFEYESRHKYQTKRLHILVCFECQSLAAEEINKFSDAILYILWSRHKIIYVYEQSRLCVKEAKLLSTKIEQYRLDRGFPNLSELQNMELKYADYMRNLKIDQNTIEVNKANYIAQMEKIKTFPDSNFSFFNKFLSLVSNKYQRQIQVDLSYLEPGKDRLQQLIAIVKANQP